MFLLSIYRRWLPRKHDRASKKGRPTVREDSKESRGTSGDTLDNIVSHITQSGLPRFDFESQTVLERGSTHGNGDDSHDRKSRGFKIDRRTISDAILGLSDGLTVPFALSAGLSSLGTTRVVILGGLAELVAGAISMGLGGFLGARSELDSYNATLEETQRDIETSPTKTSALVYDIFQSYDLSPTTITSLVRNLESSPERLLAFLMAFHHKESLPTMSRAYKTAITLAVSYFFGGLIPLIPYLVVARHEVMKALWWSIGIMGVTLLTFGYVKTCIVVGWTGKKNILAGTVGGLQMLLVGAAAVAAAIGLVKAIEQGDAFR